MRGLDHVKVGVKVELVEDGQTGHGSKVLSWKGNSEELDSMAGAKEKRMHGWVVSRGRECAELHSMAGAEGRKMHEGRVV